MNKILSQMMIHCRDQITDDQVQTLQGFKDRAAEFDSTNPDYARLLNFNLNRYKADESLPAEKLQGPVDMTAAEMNMQTIVEDLSEDMKREREEEMRSNRGNGPQIAFIDLQNMSAATAGLYVLGIIGFFGVIFYVLINKIMVKPVDFAKQKRLERATKTSSTGKKQQ